MVVTSEDEVREIRDRLAASCAEPATRRDATPRRTDVVARRVLRALDGELLAASVDVTSRRTGDMPEPGTPPAAPDVTPQPRPWDNDPWRADLPPSHGDDEASDRGEQEEPFFGW